MSIAEELNNYNGGLLDAYAAIDGKGGTVPENKNLVNLPASVQSIPSGGGGGGEPLDPQEVYKQTRPADWLKMPTASENEAYFLTKISASESPDVHFSCTVASSGEKKMEFGVSDSVGNFIAIPSLTVVSGNSGQVSLEQNVPVSNYTATLSDGTRQLLVKVSSTENITTFATSGKSLRNNCIELDVNLPSVTIQSVVGNSELYSLRYASIDLGSYGSGRRLFRNSHALVAVLKAEAAWVSLESAFEGCQSLVALPAIETSNTTNFSSMFQVCYSLTAIPQLDTSAGTNFSSMFSSCYSLTAIPQLDTSAGTNFSSMFSFCYSLTAIDLSDYAFLGATSTNSMRAMLNGLTAPVYITFGDTFSSAGIADTGTIVSTPNGTGSSPDTWSHIKITKTDSVLPIATNATTLFSVNAYVIIYVPDALLADYQANTYWATLGTRLHAMSDFPVTS